MGKPKVGPCALCKRERSLCESHILPEFLYEHVYDTGSRFVGVPTIASKYMPIYQKGIWERLLCMGCEGLFQRWEDYFLREVLQPHDHIVDVGRGRLEVRGLDYEKVKLFQLSLLWRMAITERHEFENVALPEAACEDIRRRLLNGAPGSPAEYACVLIANPTMIGPLLQTMIAPMRKQVRGKPAVLMSIAGLFWVFYLSKRPSEAVARRVAYVTADGTLPLFLEDRGSTQFLLSLWRQMSASGNVQRGLDLLGE